MTLTILFFNLFQKVISILKERHWKYKDNEIKSIIYYTGLQIMES